LQRTGRLTENGFWLNNIKSKCYAMYDNEDQAEETRMALHGVKWPMSNPKNLIVDFATEDDLKKALDESAPPPVKTVDDRRDDRWRQREGQVREWDLAKIGERSPGERERERERLRREREEERFKRRSRSQSPRGEGPKKQEEAPAKLLDDLFRKTKATPAIYWLPLTPEQIAEKEQQRRQKMIEVERMNAEIKERLKERQKKEREEREKVRAEPEKKRGST